MKVLFAVSNEAVSESIVKKYQQMYKEIIVGKNVYYFNAILKELQKDKSYDRIVISEDLEPFTNNNYDTIDNFIFEKLDNISDEAATTAGEDIPIILIATDRRTKSDNLLIKLFGIGVYSALLGQDRSIEEVCNLINKPRSKKEAKVYYKIDSSDVDYKPESDENVSETEIQNILTHYKRLGRNEDRYVESFDNIAAQYTDQQLKVIIKFLPLNVKAVLEESSPRYQQLTSFTSSRNRKLNDYQSINKTNRKNNTQRAISNSGITIESIPSQEKKLTKPVIIPSVNNVKRVTKKIENEEKIVQKLEKIDDKIEIPGIEDVETIQEATKKRGRGRPKKVKQEEEIVETKEPKRRGRPRKNLDNIKEKIQEEEEEELLPGFEQIETIEEDETLPGWEDASKLNEVDEEEIELPGFDDYEDYEDYEDEEENDEVLPGFEEETVKEESFEKENILPRFEDIEQKIDVKSEKDFFDDDYINQNETQIKSYETTNINLENLLSKDKKIVAFVGTSKNGTSFIVNNLAEMLSKQGIKTAILDLTKNKNSYYIYTKNEEELRKTAVACMNKLEQGIANGIKVNNNLDVYTSMPGENYEIQQYNNILQTLVKNYSLILLDCDFESEYEYLRQVQEIYLVQSMDVLTIQPLTAYLRELKAKGILNQNKLRIVINKYIKVRSVTEKTIIGGMAFYNDPSMSFMTELFNRETIPYCSIPFDGQVYSKYLEGLINCNITTNGYPKEIIASLRKLANMVYPLVGSSINYNNAKYNNQKYNKYSSNTFSDQMSSTLDKMKKNY